MTLHRRPFICNVSYESPSEVVYIDLYELYIYIYWGLAQGLELMHQTTVNQKAPGKRAGFALECCTGRGHVVIYFSSTKRNHTQSVYNPGFSNSIDTSTPRPSLTHHRYEYQKHRLPSSRLHLLYTRLPLLRRPKSWKLKTKPTRLFSLICRGRKKKKTSTKK